ncbi:MAG TPA: adenylate/guanylate cyclase domain-containing protein [Actinomycetota bacterium]|nr:adenylate/guanylate cyclase domain-containing protein [Actinomycetota bacterium]
MPTCMACGNRNPEHSKFCNGCGSRLAEPLASAEERKVVTVLFCDLVGFTSRSELADPEDVRAIVRPYYEVLRKDIESYGGTVEKFIGDAVMAVFGAPSSHDDDPERAVHAGLRILEAIEQLNRDRGTDLSVRVGINTGEVVVALEARPERGEGIVTGDVVNTAARLQTGAPIGGIAVGETTYLSTSDVFDYEPLEAIAAKNKARRVPAWRALAARARFGTDITRRHEVALVGRDAERAMLGDLLDEAIRQRSRQLVTIVGEPGVGKSRMVHELSHLVDARDGTVVWRRGRCLPYGEGIAFWALGEIVKAEAGVLDSDSPEQAETKLDRSLKGLPFESEELGWVKARLTPLVGVEPPSTAEREESFTAWGRFLEVLAQHGGAVFVFEDLHWADPALLEFVEHVAGRSEAVPMVLVCTARPEFAERNQHWAGELRNATVVDLAPLSGEETAMLVGELLGSTLPSAEVRRPIVEAAGGNPLYAEEFVRMLRDRGLLVARGETWELAEDAEVAIPEGIHGIISARLDTLTPDRKGLLHDASVVGKVFWPGALEAMGDRDGLDVREALHELTRKQYLRPSRTLSMEGEREYTFWHMLVRDAAYAQIPRAARGQKHTAVARWLEARAGARVEDLADVLAYHWFEALELTRASGGEVSGLERQALRFLVLAGDRARGLEASQAQAMYERALGLAPEGDPVRAEILRDLAGVEWSRGHFGRSRELLEEAIPALLAAGRPARAADAKVMLAVVWTTIAPGDTDWRLLDEAVAELERLPRGEELVSAYALRANWVSSAGQYAEAIDWADRSLALAQELGLPNHPWARIQRGGARCWSGDMGGIDDIHQGIELAIDQGSVNVAAMGRNQLATVLQGSSGPAEALSEIELGAALARRSGMQMMTEFLEVGARSEALFHLGRWAEMLEATTVYLAEDRQDIAAQVRLVCQVLACEVSTWHGDLARASELSLAIQQATKEFDAPWPVVELAVVAEVALATGDVDRAAEALHELEAYPHMREDFNNMAFFPEITRVAMGAVSVEFAQQLMTGIPESPMPLRRISLEMVDAQLAEALGELDRAEELYAMAEEGWRTFSVPERAQSLLGRGRCLVAMGDPGSLTVLREARAVFSSLKAELHLPEVDSLLELAVARSS